MYSKVAIFLNIKHTQLTCYDDEDGRVEVGVRQEVQVMLGRYLDVRAHTDHRQPGCGKEKACGI